MAARATDWENRLAASIEPDLVVDLTRQAVRFATVNPPGNEGALAEHFAAILTAEGIETRLLSHGEGRASLACRLRGSGGRPALIMTGHLDVVGAGERPWRHAPFGAELDNGRVYGRGASDMKGAIAAMVGATIALRRCGAPLAGDLILALTAGEEVDSLGAQALASAGLLAGADAILIGEPSDLEVYVAEKGNLTIEIRTHGRTAHASMPELGHNAIYAMAAVITALEQHSFTVPRHALLGEPTISVGQIQGGVKSNVVPDGCTIQVDVRTLPGQRHEGVLDDLRALFADLAQRRPRLEAEITRWLGREAVDSGAGSAIAADVVAAVYDVTGRRPEPAGVMYATDASVLVPALGLPMAICGPGPREMAHQTDEYVAVDALGRAAAIYGLVALRRLMSLPGSP